MDAPSIYLAGRPYYIDSYGCGYYAVHTSAYHFGQSLPIHGERYPGWGTSFGECQEILRYATESYPFSLSFKEA